ncbi:MAG: phosphatase PAP2 family protein [Prevotellaceae bacterium]|jgi:hypothetical protein|nr:phosphatase PAP2 family protein [Prevotellaceae bacterium]
MKKVTLCAFLLGAFSFTTPAQEEIVVKEVAETASGDTVLLLLDSYEQFPKKKKITDYRLYQMGKVPVTFFLLSGLAYPIEHYMREVRDYQIPDFNYSYDDYLQFTPGIAVFALKIAGVDGYSDWGRLLTETSVSGVVTVGLFSGIKYLVDKERPNTSNLNSFPSGHTATAFMMASWLHKEYGLTRSPFYSIAGYSVATIVGVTRQLRNKHWYSDVLFGAGVGYLGVEVGYWISDLIFKDKGIKIPHAKRMFVDLKESKPSFINLSMGYVTGNGIELTEDIHFKGKGGYGISVEGAWFINPYLGFGGNFTSNTIDYAFDQDNYLIHHKEHKDDMTRIKINEDFAGIYSGNIGGYFAYPLSNRFTLGSKLLGGITGTSSSNLVLKLNPTAEYPAGQQVNALSNDKDISWSLETGVSATFLLNRNLGVSFFADYLFSDAKITFKKGLDVPLDMRSVGEEGRSNKFDTHNLTVGLSVNAYFF